MSDLLSASYFMSSAQNFETARKKLYELKIKTSYDEGRVILSVLHGEKTRMSNIIAQESNGLILDRTNWKPLAVPPRCMRINIETETSNQFLQKGYYMICKAADGTCINLYWYQDRWVMSTVNGFDMNNVKFGTSGETWQELFNECLAELEFTWETFTQQLDKTKCYSFGFRHPKYHPFKPTHTIWFIQSVDLDSTTEYYLWANYTVPGFLVGKISAQEQLTEPVGNIKDLYKICADSLNNFLNTGEVCYGFILRSFNPQLTGAHSDLFIESSLMRKIKSYWYDNRLVGSCRENNWSKNVVVGLSAWLTSDHEVFLKMFPEFSSTFDSYSQLVETIIDQMLVDANHVLMQKFNKRVEYSLTDKTEEQKKKTLREFVISGDNFTELMRLV